jgi:hypothetical protein
VSLSLRSWTMVRTAVPRTSRTRSGTSLICTAMGAV